MTTATKEKPPWFWPLMIGGPSILVALTSVVARDLPSKVVCDEGEYEFTSQRFYIQSNRADVCTIRHLLGRIEKLEAANKE